jgi:hypothetical protein
MFKIFKCVHSKKYSSGKQVTIWFNVIVLIDFFEIVSDR